MKPKKSFSEVVDQEPQDVIEPEARTYYRFIDAGGGLVHLETVKMVGSDVDDVILSERNFPNILFRNLQRELLNSIYGPK